MDNCTLKSSAATTGETSFSSEDNVSFYDAFFFYISCLLPKSKCLKSGPMHSQRCLKSLNREIS